MGAADRASRLGPPECPGRGWEMGAADRASRLGVPECPGRGWEMGAAEMVGLGNGGNGLHLVWCPGERYEGDSSYLGVGQ